MTHHLCAEDVTKTCIVPSLTDEEKDDLLTRGVLPPESTASEALCRVSSEEGLTKALTI